MIWLETAFPNVGAEISAGDRNALEEFGRLNSF